MERTHPGNIRMHDTTHKHTPGHTHMLKLSPETAREQKSNGDVRAKRRVWEQEERKTLGRKGGTQRGSQGKCDEIVVAGFRVQMAGI